MARPSKAQRRHPRRNNPAVVRAAQAALALAPLAPRIDDATMAAERQLLAATVGRTRYGDRVLAAHDKLTPYRKAAGRAAAAVARRIQELAPVVTEARRVRAALQNPHTPARSCVMLLSDAFGPMPAWADDIQQHRGSRTRPAASVDKPKRPRPRRNPPPVVGLSCFVKGKPAVVVAYPAPGTKGRVQVRFRRTGALMSVTPASVKTVPPRKK